jgi:8-oxo-dGTP diphosphatase
MIELAGCVIIKDEKLLLLHKLKENHYEFPGGKVQKGEVLWDTATREAKEEIGCDVDAVTYIGYYDFAHDNKELRSHLFYTSINKGIPAIQETGFDELIWMPLSKFNEYKLAPNVQLFCKEYMLGKFPL